MNYRALYYLSLLLALHSFLSLNANVKTKPNIVIILADDLGWADVSFHSDRIPTPNIDRIAEEGVELDRFYVFPMCSPTRAGLMTGRYPIRFGMARSVIPPWRNFGLDPDEITLPEALGKLGYTHRGIFGKWHLGHNHTKWHPNNQGFTHFHGHYNGAIDYFTLSRENERDWHLNKKSNQETGYSTDLIASAASNFILKHSKEEEPFFCYVPFNSPHSPFQAPEKYIKKFQHLAGLNSKGKNKSLRQVVAAMVSCMDDGIGKILKAIDTSGEADNTIVWFFSDNGGIGGLQRNNLPLRGNKLDVWEGGVRVAAAIRWPNGGVQGGLKISVPLSCIDVCPTLINVSGGDDVSSGNKAFDGCDVLDILKGNFRNLNRELYFYHGQAGEAKEKIAIRTEKWKLVIHGPNINNGHWKTPKHECFLFRIDIDPNETTNLFTKHFQVAERLVSKLIAYRKLQPESSVDIYSRGREAFEAPKDWLIK